jgi:hypothetical protein
MDSYASSAYTTTWKYIFDYSTETKEMSKKELSVYTAGSVSDLGDTDSNWRKTLPDIKGIRWLNPALAPNKKDFCFAFPRDIIQLKESDVIIAIFNKDKVQRGTSAETGLAYALGKIVIIISDSNENDYQLRYILGFAHHRVRTLKEAIELLSFMAKGFIDG